MFLCDVYLFICICLYICPLRSNIASKSYPARPFTCHLYLFVTNDYHLYVYVQETSGHRKTGLQQKNQLALCYINGDECMNLNLSSVTETSEEGIGS